MCLYETNGYTFLRQTVLHVRLPLILVRDEFGVSRPSSSSDKVHNPGWRAACWKEILPSQPINHYLASLSDDLQLWWLVYFLALAPWFWSCLLPYKPDSSVEVLPFILTFFTACLLLLTACLCYIICFMASQSLYARDESCKVEDRFSIFLIPLQC